MNFYLPDGQTSSGFETWTLVENPNPDPVTIRVTYLFQGGQDFITFTEQIPAETRSTYSMADEVPSSRASILVESLDDGSPVIVERSMYKDNRSSGTDTVGGYSE